MMLLVSHWSASVGVLAPIGVAVALHWRGMRSIRAQSRSPSPARRHKERRQQAWLFYGSLVAIGLALVSPLDYWSEVDFWPHMLQHLILLYVAAPLVVLGAPWLVLLRGLPGGPRRRLLRFLYRARAGVRLRRTLGALTNPVVATTGFLASFLAWHLPVAYDLTLTNRYIHDLEHACFLVIGVWLWSQLVGSYPYRPRWEPVSRVWLVAAVLFGNWMLAIAMAFARKPWYPAYAHVAAAHMSLLSDQELAAACMWVLPMIPLGVAAFHCLNVWLAHQDDEELRLQEMITKTRAARLRWGNGK